MSKEAKILIGIAVVVIAVGILLAMQEPKPDPTFDKPADAGQLVREDSNIKGGKDAKVTVVEFLDFECEACRASYPVVKQVLAEYGDKVKFVQRYFPLPNHKNSQSAALAAAAAGEQGKFWEMHDKLFENQSLWTYDNAQKTTELQAKEMFISYAKELGLNIDQFTQSLEEKKYLNIIQRDIADANELGVNSTPTFYINGTKQAGGLSLDKFKEKIDAELKK